MVQMAQFGTESQCWGCEQPEPAVQGSQAVEGPTVGGAPQLRPVVLMLPALATKAAGIRHNPASTHQPPVAGGRRAVNVDGKRQTQKHGPAALPPPYHVIAQVVPLAYQRGQPPANPYCDGFVGFFFNSSLTLAIKFTLYT